jgi:hypothetical protein
MFMQPPVKKAKGGIISLFNDIVGEDEDAFANRTPDNPEILANNIRGDIKSLDERYDELAQVLGEKAYETPEEVLVYMQSQMPKAQPPQAPTPAPGQGGIASMAQQVPPGGAPRAAPQAGPSQPPGGIESLVAQPPQQPVQRAMGSGPMGEVSDPLASAVENFIDSGGTLEQLVAMAAGDMPVQRAGGSPESGERIDPRFRDPMTRQFFIPEGMQGPIPTAEAGGVRRNMPALERQLVQEEVLDADPSQRASAQPKSRPLTPEEMRESLLRKESGSKGLSLLRDIGDIAKTRFGIDPSVVRQRLSQGLEAFSKIPGVGKFGKMVQGLDKTKAATGAFGVGFGTAALYDYLTPDGEDPSMSKHPLVSNIPVPGKLIKEERDFTAQEEERDFTAQEEKRDFTAQEEKRDFTAQEEERDFTSQEDGDIRLNKPQPGASVSKQDNVSGFEKRVRERADIYKRLMGDDPDMRKAQAHFILAEAGLALAGAKGRSLGERLSKGLRGVPSAFGALAAEQTQLNRAATTAAIAAIEQQDRDAMTIAGQIQKAMYASSGKGLPRQQQIMARASVLQQGYGMSPDEAQNMATLMVDGGLNTDKFANIRDPLGNVVRYGPLNKPMSAGDIGYIPAKNPYARQPQAKPIPVLAENDMAKIRDEISQIEKMLTTLQGAKGEISKAVGPLNVLTRGITSVTQPLFGDIGPLSADKVSVKRSVDNANKVLQQFAAINPERVSVYEQQQNRRLQIDGDSLFTSPDIEIGKLMGIETYLTNQLNSLRYQLNPRDTDYRQMDVPNLGSKNDPVPSNAYTLLPDYFAARPTGTIYIKRPDGSTIGVTRDWAVSQGLIK